MIINGLLDEVRPRGGTQPPDLKDIDERYSYTLFSYYVDFDGKTSLPPLSQGAGFELLQRRYRHFLTDQMTSAIEA